MEQKNLITQVFSDETLFRDSAELPIDIDFTMPDYCPEISKLLKCRALARISSKIQNGNTVSAEGAVTVTVIYADDERRLCSYEYQYPFSKSFETGCDCDGAFSSVKCRCEYMNCRAVTGRKIDLHGAVGIFVTLKKRRSTDVISDVDMTDVELNRGSAAATVPMGCAEKYLIIEEEIEIGQGQPVVRSLLRYDACTGLREAKLMNEKVIVKGDLAVSILYCPENGNSQTVKMSIPFSQILEMPGVNDSCRCDPRAEIAALEIRPRISASGECRSFSLNVKLLIGCDAYCDGDIPVILDAYSRKFETEIQKKDLPVKRICKNINELYQCKSNIDLPDGALSGIVDLWCDVRSDAVRVKDGQLSVDGTVTAYIIATDNDGAPVLYEKPIGFQYRCPVECNSVVQCDPQLEVVSASYTLTGVGIELRVDLGVNATVYELKELSLITELTVKNQPLPANDYGAMNIYFSTAGEKLWEIARRYRASVNELMEINHLNSDTVPEDRTLLIPTC